MSLLPQDFKIDDEMRQWAESAVHNVNIARSHERFCDYYWSTGKTMVDWTACWRNWMRRNMEWGKDLYTQDELRIQKMMDDFGNKGFRRAFKHENSVMYQVAFDAWDLKNRQPKRDTSSVISTLVTQKRAQP